MRTAVFVGLAFAIGIIAEDLSYKHVDSIQTPIRSVPAKILPEELINTLDLPSKFDSRVKTLIIDPAGTPRPDWLAIDLGRSKAFSLAEPSNGPVVEAWIESAKDCDKTSATASCPPPPAGLHDAILRLYYLAKNKVYAQPHHYDELKRIQSRQEFSRSLAMIAFFYLVVGLLMLVPFLIIIRLNPKSIGAQLEFGKRHLKVAGVLGMLFCVFLLAVWAYERESDEFNKRAFGYFSSMLIKADQAEPDADRKAEDSAPKNPTSQ